MYNRSHPESLYESLIAGLVRISDGTCRAVISFGKLMFLQIISSRPLRKLRNVNYLMALF